MNLQYYIMVDVVTYISKLKEVAEMTNKTLSSLNEFSSNTNPK